MADNTSKALVAVNCNIIRNLSRANVGLVIHKQRNEIVTLVGKVVSMQEENTRISYLVSDSTSAPIDVVQWKNSDTQVSHPSKAIKSNCYVRISGMVNYKNNNLYIAAYRIALIEDLNEITMHNLEVVHNCLMLRKIKMDHYASRGDLPFERDSKLLMQTSRPGVGSTENKTAALLDSIRKFVGSQMATEVNGVNGVPRVEIYDRFPSQNRNEIDEALTNLCNEGLIYTTIDDDHFQSPEN